ncbi:MAG: hypothetical protein ACYCZM_11945 [Acidimicrobiales bacterium]
MFLLAALPEVIVSLVLLLLVLAGLQLIRFLHDATNGLPFPLNAISGWVLGNAERTLTTIRGWALSGMRAVGAFLLAIFHVPITLFDEAVKAFEAIWTLGATLRAAMTTLYHQSTTWAWNLAVSVQHTVSANLSHVEGLIAGLGTDVTRAIDQLRNDLATEVKAIDGVVAGDAARLEQVISADVAGLAQQIVNDVGRAEQTAARDLVGAVAGIEADIAATRTDVIDWVNGLAKGLEGSIERTGAVAAAGTAAAVAAVLALIQTGVMATVATITTELEDCVRPNCSWMNGLGSTFAGLLSYAELALLLGFLAETQVDPALAVEEIVTVMSPVVDGVYSLMADVITGLHDIHYVPTG